MFAPLLYTIPAALLSHTRTTGRSHTIPTAQRTHYSPFVPVTHVFLKWHICSPQILALSAVTPSTPSSTAQRTQKYTSRTSLLLTEGPDYALPSGLGMLLHTAPRYCTHYGKLLVTAIRGRSHAGTHKTNSQRQTPGAISVMKPVLGWTQRQFTPTHKR
jgi:hypothetical protein